MLLAAPVVALFACNGILGTSDYKVGGDGDAGTGGDPSQGDGGNTGTGGSPGTGEATGSGGKATGSGGKATGTGGLMPPGSGGAGGKGSGGSTNPGTGGTAGSLTAADFIGEWDTDAETQTTQCDDGLGPMTDVVANAIEWTAGTGGTIEALDGPSCKIVARISGRVATIVPAPCDEMGATYTISGTFTILPNGTARLDHQVDAYIPPDTCTGTATGIYTKYIPP